jgi:hypothetical protein
MYSPKIKAELVKRLYAEKKRRGMAMTELINSIVENALKHLEQESVPEVYTRTATDRTRERT